MKTAGALHERLVFSRRVKVLAGELAAAIPAHAASVLDVGCGDGSIDVLLSERRPDLQVTGVDVLVRPHTKIPVTAFDGEHLPCPDKSVDVVMFADVLHHTSDPEVLLREAQRVARQAVVLKDHTRDGLLAYTTLRFMDWVGNAHHGVVLPYNYWPKARWKTAFASRGLKIQKWKSKIPLYPWPASLVFGRHLHFVATLVESQDGADERRRHCSALDSP